MHDIVEVIRDLFAGLADAGGVALAHLRPARNSGLDHMAVTIKGQLPVEVPYKSGLLGPLADQAPVALQNIEKLRQFVAAVFTQKLANPRGARVVPPANPRPVIAAALHPPQPHTGTPPVA